MQDTYTQVGHKQGDKKRKRYIGNEDTDRTWQIQNALTSALQFSKAEQTHNKSITGQKQYSQKIHKQENSYSF